MNYTQVVLDDVSRHGPTTARACIKRLRGSVKPGTTQATLSRLARQGEILSMRGEDGITVYVQRDNLRALPARRTSDPRAQAAWNAWLRRAA